MRTVQQEVCYRINRWAAALRWFSAPPERKARMLRMLYRLGMWR